MADKYRRISGLGENKEKFTEIEEGVYATTVAIASGLEGSDNTAILAELEDLNAAIGAAGDAAGANTVIGQLKQIAINTTPA